MGRNSRWIGAGVIGLSMALAVGCARDLPPWATAQNSLSDDISVTPEPRLARLQTQDSPGLTLPKPTQGPLAVKMDAPPPAAPGASGGIQTVSMANRGTVRISIRAWVNGRPIFDDEVMQMAGPDLAKAYSSPGASEKMTELINNVLDQLIDQELMYQQAVKTIEKNNPKALKQLRQLVDQEFDKTLERWRGAKIPEAQIREMEPVARRLMERNLISTEYARARIIDFVKGSVNIEMIREYYETHKNEFQTVDKVVWQNIFIPLSPNLPTIEDAKRFAEELINKCRMPDDFNRLMVYNEGPSKLNNGLGLGQRRGEIRPAELEQALFDLREKEIGPVIPFTTGVHLMRVLSREYAAQQPLDDKVQNAIRKKLENQLMEREYKRITRELKTRAVIRLERNLP